MVPNSGSNFEQPRKFVFQLFPKRIFLAVDCGSHGEFRLRAANPIRIEHQAVCAVILQIKPEERGFFQIVAGKAAIEWKVIAFHRFFPFTILATVGLGCQRPFVISKNCPSRISRYRSMAATLHPAILAISALSSGSRTEEHTSELQSHSFISYAVFCLKKKKH